MDSIVNIENILENESQVKKRLIELNDYEHRKKNNTIVVILSAFVSFFISFIGLLLYLSKIVTLQTFFTTIFISSILFMILSYGVYKNTWKSLKKYSSELQDDILSEGEKLELKAKQWVDDNCECKKTE